MPDLDTDDRFVTMRRELLERGYRDVDDFKGLKIGARVYHVGHRWFGAEQGTATVRAVMLKDPSAWTVSWRRPDVELIVEYDAGHDPGLHGLADYHVRLADTDD